MPAWLTTLLGGVPALITGIFSYITNRSTINNSPAMQANVQAKKDQAEDEKIKADILKAHQGDVKPIEIDEA